MNCALIKSSLTPDTNTMSESGASYDGGSLSMSRAALISSSVSISYFTMTALLERARMLVFAVRSDAQMMITCEKGLYLLM